MVEIRLASKIVKLVLVNHVTYIAAVDEVFPNERKTFQSSNISVFLAKQTIKHFFLFENLYHQKNLDLNDDKKILLFVVLTNNLFANILNKNSCASFLEGEIGKEEFEKIVPVLKHKGEIEELICFEKDSDFFYATKYNVPIWLVHMWRKHYDDDLIKDFLEAAQNYDLQSYAVNTFKSSTEEILEKYPQLESPFENALIFNGTTRYQTTEEFKNDKYFDVKLAFKSLIDDYVNSEDEVMLYSGYEDDFAKAAIVNTQGKAGLNLIVPDMSYRYDVLRFIRINKLRNINMFQANDEYGFDAGISYKQNTVIVFPESSRFDIATKYPDFLLRFDRESLDKLIEDERHALELCSKYVEDGGTLVYIVNTLNKKESYNIISEFLLKHPRFKLIRDNQLTASHPFGTTMYYAVLTLEGESND